MKVYYFKEDIEKICPVCKVQALVIFEVFNDNDEYENYLYDVVICNNCNSTI